MNATLARLTFRQVPISIRMRSGLPVFGSLGWLSLDLFDFLLASLLETDLLGASAEISLISY